MATANIVKAYTENNRAHIIANVNEGGEFGTVEYHASVPMNELQELATPQRKAKLIEAVKKVRRRWLAGNMPSSSDLGISGTVTL